MSTDEHVPSDDQVRGRYCDGTYVQTGHATEGNEFDAWLARVRRDAEAELDSWMTRAYEAEKRAWQAEKRIEAVLDMHEPRMAYRLIDGEDFAQEPDGHVCVVCREYYPCDTIRDLEGMK